MIFDPREIKQQPPIETKSASASAYSTYLSFPEFLMQSGLGDLSAYAAIQLYVECMPLFNAIDMRASAFSQIPIRLWNKRTEEFIDDHPVLELLSKPNSDVSKMEFLEAYSSFFDITGNSFLVATGRIENPPLELMTAPPQHITFGQGNRFGMLHVPDDIRVTTYNSGETVFKAKEDIDKGLRYINSMEDKEIWHTRSFNPLRSSSHFWGLSKARPLWLEIQQYISGNNTNLSMLKRGTKLSLAWVNNRGEELTDIQWNRLQEEAQKYMGDVNAGGTPILDGMDVKPIQQTNRDMEFKDLQEAMLARISIAYGIPLALLVPESMTLNNLETSLLQFFDRTILPLTNRHYDELSRFILPRYEDTADLEFRYNEQEISAVRARMIATAKDLNEISVNTIDEIRSVIGYEGLAAGGDVILRPSTLVPVGEDAFTQDEPMKPTATEKFRALMRDAGYTSKEIEDTIENKFNGT